MKEIILFLLILTTFSVAMGQTYKYETKDEKTGELVNTFEIKLKKVNNGFKFFFKGEETCIIQTDKAFSFLFTNTTYNNGEIIVEKRVENKLLVERTKNRKTKKKIPIRRTTLV
jgi:hypothetical protein